MDILVAKKSEALQGDVNVPGDKSISHRSIMFSSIALGQTKIYGLLEGEDVMATAAAFRAMGVHIERDSDAVWHVDGVGLYGLKAPNQVLNMGNSGTTTRLMMGILAGQGFTTQLTGDASLTKRPMRRVTNPLGEMGAKFIADDTQKHRLPLSLQGREDLMALRYELPVASAQVKSAILLAGLYASGRTTVIEPTPTRDHTENMLRGFGVDIGIKDSPSGLEISVQGQQVLTSPGEIHVPGDPSSAAFLIVAALLAPNSAVLIRNVCINERRAGLIECLQMMGGEITLQNKRNVAGEVLADIAVKTSQLKAIHVPERLVPSMIDEFPVLSVAAAFAQGETVMTDIGELRVKESDRIQLMADGLSAAGVHVTTTEDSMAIQGMDKVTGGVSVDAKLDHRIAMSFAILGLNTQKPMTITGATAIQTSFPNFIPLMQSLNANIEEKD